MKIFFQNLKIIYNQLVDIQLITKTITMTGLRRSHNPFLSGNRPRRYFSDLIEKLRRRTQVKDTRVFNPDWNKGKKAA